MRIPRFWKQASKEVVTPDGRRINSTAWGWSEHSSEEAESRAFAAVKRVAARLAKEKELPQHYGYDERLPREEIIDEFQNETGKTHAIVTRNGYGSLILNTSDLMFIDVDLPPKREEIPLPRFVRKWLGQPPPVDPVVAYHERIRDCARQHADLGFRLYRTCAGFRVIVASHAIPAESSLAKQLLEDFRADPLYQRMCKNQECFRARLTPKAWRCGIDKPPARFPFPNPRAESSYRRWEKQYLDSIANYSTCSFLESLGPNQVDRDIEGLIELHDSLTKSSSNDELA